MKKNIPTIYIHKHILIRIRTQKSINQTIRLDASYKQ